MKKIILIMLVILLLMISNLTYASEVKSVLTIPSISYSATIATCKVSIYGEKATDKISITVKLKQGTNLIRSWNKSVNDGILQFTGTASVERGKTYTLYVYPQINGVSKPCVTYSKKYPK